MKNKYWSNYPMWSKKLSLTTLLVSGALSFSLYAQDAETKVPAEKPAVPEKEKAAQPDETPKEPGDNVAEKRLAEVAQKLSIKEQEQRIKSLNLMELGKKKYTELDYESAESFFKKSVEANADNKEAQEWLQRIEKETGKSPENRHLGVQNLSDLESIRVQEYRAEADNQLAKARALINESITLVDSASAGDQLTALAEAEKRLVLSWKKYQNLLEQLALRRTFPGFDVRTYQEKAESGKKDASNMLDQLTIRRKKLDQKLAIDKEKSENDRNQKYFEDKIKEQLITAEHQLELKNYDSAERIARDVLKEDPNNSKARSIKKQARKKRHKNFEKTVPKILEDNIKEGNSQIDEYEIPFQDIVVYPSEWEDFIQLRKSDGSSEVVKTPWKIALLQRMETPVHFDFTNTGFKDGLNELSLLANITIAFDKKLFTEGGVDPEAPIQMSANGMSFKHALKWILSNVNADYSLYSQAVYITPKGQITGDTVMQTYSILDLTTPPRSFTGPDIQPGVGATISAPLDTAEPDASALNDANIKELIKEKIARDSWDDAKGTSIEVFQGKLIIVHNEEVQEQVTAFLSELREAQTLQVVIQARFIDVREGALEEIGVSWKGLDQANVNDIGGLGQQGAGYLSDVRRLDDYDARGIISNPSTVGSFDRPFSPAPTADRMGLQGQFAILGNVQAAAIFHAVATSGEGIELQAPSVTVFNNTTAHIDVAVSRNYIRDYAVVNGNYDPTIDQFFEGVVLEVKPTVSSDRKYITMEVKPTIATLIGIDVFTFNALAAFGVAGGNAGNPAGGNAPRLLSTITLAIEVPNIRYERLRTTVNLPDRSVVLLGGLMRSLKGDSQSGVPLLSNIPFLGRLFKNKSSASAKDNLMISMSGRIVIFEEIENEL